ncbi:uncharacterized protein LOC105701955 [Orussus abietinus]|uniref:uncharacterized protein LOC105701955 n=1 Tax=Orussus abietinus TaxID=222816 RepID=UPI000C716319|nr:uncharacterized protein LOC105701955 [Orussus abietinus]
MKFTSVALAVLCCSAVYAMAEEALRHRPEFPSLEAVSDDQVHSRTKRTIFLKKKLLGAGLLGFGLGIAKGYKAGFLTAPPVHHVYVAPPSPPVKYIEYVERPVYVERIVEKPVFKSEHVEYEHGWSQPEPPSGYGRW